MLRQFTKGIMSATFFLCLTSTIIFSGCKKETVESIEVFDKKTELNAYFETLKSFRENIASISPSISNNPALIKNILAEQDAEKKMAPLVTQTKRLLKAFQLFDNIESQLGYDDKYLITAGIILFDKEKWQLEAESPRNSDILIKTNKAAEITPEELTHCLLDAFGLGAGFGAIYKVAAKMAVKDLVTLAISVLGRSVSWVGLAYTAYNLTTCLMDESND